MRATRADGTEQVAIVGIDGTYQPLKTLEGWCAVGKIFFSPDGRYLAYSTRITEDDRRRDLFIIAADGSGETPVHDSADDAVMGWSPDGRFLAYSQDAADGRRHLAIHALDTNLVRELPSPFVYMPLPRWFPDGRSLVVGGRDEKGRGRVARIDVETGQEIPALWACPLSGSAEALQGVHVSPDGTKVYYAAGDFGPDTNRSGMVMEQELAIGVTREVIRSCVTANLAGAAKVRRIGLNASYPPRNLLTSEVLSQTLTPRADCRGGCVAPIAAAEGWRPRSTA